MKRFILMSIAMAVLAVCVMSQNRAMSPMMGPVGEIVKELKLTDQQQKDFERIKADMMKSMINQGAKLATARVDLSQLLNADSPDRPAIEKKIDEMGDQAAQLGKMMVGQWFAVNKILTPDQQKTWKKALDLGPMMQGWMRGGESGWMQGKGPGSMMQKRIEIRKEKGKSEEDDKD
jgi:Spy/CpxP family protein refolding chaperone